MSISKLVRWLAVVAAVIVAAFATWGFWLEPSSLRLTEYKVGLASCPPPLCGLRIAAISDLHAGAPYIDAAKLHRVADLTNAAYPDLILIAGDIFVQQTHGGHPLPPEIVQQELALLHAPLGVYAVLGNHDYDEHFRDYRQRLRDVGITPLDNDVHLVPVGDAHFWIAGFGDAEKGSPDIPGTMAKITDSAPVIGLTHNPVLFDSVPASVNLLIAGHTHGGQVSFTRITRWALRRKWPLPYLNGHYRKQTDLFVTTGVGTSGWPMRIRVPPEISLLTLTPDSGETE